jgi:ATP-dependent DNA helicase RecG
MNDQAIKETLDRLRALPHEQEIVEFKEAKNGYDFAKIGRYFSALCNEANLMRKEQAWLVLGIRDRDHAIVGSDFRRSKKDLDSLKKEIADKTTNRITFIEIYEVLHSEGRVVLLQIPPAPRGIPVAFEGHYYGRDGESLAPLNLEELERIRFQRTVNDWSAVVLPDATLQDLDPDAIAKARREFAKRNPKYKDDIPTWDDAKFLAKAKLTIQGKITRAAMILLGREESEYLLNSAVKIRWNLKAANGNDRDYEVFSIPFILTIEEIQRKVRNLKYRYVRYDALFPEEVLRYEPFNIREPINNAIAHQDYSQGARINVVEFEDDRLVFSNYGTFIPKSVEEVVLRDTPEELYRNPFLVEAMKNFDMIETQGGGIRKLFQYQRDRLFPMPEYDFSDGKVKVTIIGRVLDEEFARILIHNPSLSLEDLLMLDKVQKQKMLTGLEAKYLRQQGWIEGRKPNYFLSHTVINPIPDDDLKAQYIHNRSFDDQHFKDMILEYLKKFGPSKRDKIDNLIVPKLSAILSDKQKRYKVTNLLSALRLEGKIQNQPGYKWVIVKQF